MDDAEPVRFKRGLGRADCPECGTPVRLAFRDGRLFIGRRNVVRRVLDKIAGVLAEVLA